jgi:hypothetical protein
MATKTTQIKNEYHSKLKAYLISIGNDYKYLAKKLEVSETYVRLVANKHKPMTRSFVQRMFEANIL